MTEVIGHRDAVQFVRQLATDIGHSGLREIDVRNLHRMLMASEPRIAGQYKVFDNQISGSKELLTARSDDVGWHMAQLIAWMNSARAAGPLLAAVVHAWLANIHPFEDGNGRVARLLANYGLYRQQWPCLVIKSGTDRGQYYDALSHSDAAGDILPLFELFTKSLERALLEMSDPDFARRLLRADMDRIGDYDLWCGNLRSFVAALREKLTVRSLQLEVLGHLQASDFVLLQHRKAAGNGWFAKVRGRSLSRSFDVLIWFGFATDELLGETRACDPMPSLFFSERNESPDFPHPYRWLRGSEELDVCEVSLRPSTTSERATLRRSGDVRPMGIERAAGLVASSSRDFGSAGPLLDDSADHHPEVDGPGDSRRVRRAEIRSVALQRIGHISLGGFPLGCSRKSRRRCDCSSTSELHSYPASTSGQPPWR
ncbi:MAG: Fic family protein [Acidimicrobiales bacterium]